MSNDEHKKQIRELLLEFYEQKSLVAALAERNNATGEALYEIYQATQNPHSPSYTMVLKNETLMVRSKALDTKLVRLEAIVKNLDQYREAIRRLEELRDGAKALGITLG